MSPPTRYPTHHPTKNTSHLADDSPEMVDAVVAELRPRYGSWGNFPNGVTANIRGIVRSLR
jgi:hypothetical protein